MHTELKEISEFLANGQVEQLEAELNSLRSETEKARLTLINIENDLKQKIENSQLEKEKLEVENKSLFDKESDLKKQKQDFETRTKELQDELATVKEECDKEIQVMVTVLSIFICY